MKFEKFILKIYLLITLSEVASNFINTKNKKKSEFIKEKKGISFYSCNWSRRNEISTTSKCY